jgi:hypothetical protein
MAQSQGMTREQRLQAFRDLVLKHGLKWGPRVPSTAYALLAEIDLTEAEKREALGLN